MAGLLDTVRDLGRLRQIVQVLIKHGFGEVVQQAGLGSLVPGKAKSEHDARVSRALRKSIIAYSSAPLPLPPSIDGSKVPSLFAPIFT